MELFVLCSMCAGAIGMRRPHPKIGRKSGTVRFTARLACAPRHQPPDGACAAQQRDPGEQRGAGERERAVAQREN